MAKVKIGMPSRSRGTTLTGLRTDSDTSLPGVAEIQGDLAAGISQPDDKHPAPGKRLRVRVIAGVNETSRKAVHARPRGTQRPSRDAGGEDDIPGGQRRRVVSDPPAGTVPDAEHCCPEARRDPMMGGVVFEIGHE